jgi:large subunit ribosomal protein L31
LDVLVGIKYLFYLDLLKILCIIPWLKVKVYIMKQGIHPEYFEINVKRTDGKTIKMYSSVNKDLSLSMDNLNHSAWTGSRVTVEKGQRSASFNKKFDGFKF